MHESLRGWILTQGAVNELPAPDCSNAGSVLFQMQFMWSRSESWLPEDESRSLQSQILNLSPVHCLTLHKERGPSTDPDRKQGGWVGFWGKGVVYDQRC